MGQSVKRSERLAVAILVVGLAGAVPALGEDVKNALGVVHAGGKYNFTSEDYLNEGGDELLGLGTQVMKVWFTLSPATSYPFNSNWGPTPTDYVALAQNPYYQSLFAKPLTTFILVVAGETTPVSAFLDGLTAQEISTERAQMHDLARYLLLTYSGTGKTFIIQNWEGDHVLRAGLSASQTPTQQRITHLASWWDARQDGITEARQEVGAIAGVAVYGAIEINALADAVAGKVTATNNVLPLTYADLYSYSSWDVDFDPDKLTLALDYLASKAPPSAAFGHRNIYVGEFGAAKDQVPPSADRAAIIRHLAETSLSWGARWALYWQLYDNEELKTVTGRPSDQDMRGFWLIRPDGIKSPMWFEFSQMMDGEVTHLALHTLTGQLLTAPGTGGGPLAVFGPNPSPWQVFAARGSTGGALSSGDVILLRAHNGMVVSSQAGSFGTVFANGWDGGRSQEFVVKKVAGSGALQQGDRVTLQDARGRYLTSYPGARGGAVRADRSSPGPASTFIFDLRD